MHVFSIWLCFSLCEQQNANMLNTRTVGDCVKEGTLWHQRNQAQCWISALFHFKNGTVSDYIKYLWKQQQNIGFHNHGYICIKLFWEYYKYFLEEMVERLSSTMCWKDWTLLEGSWSDRRIQLADRQNQSRRTISKLWLC